MPAGEARVAVLVDCDNVSPEIMEYALRVVAQFGRVVVRRGYGNHGTSVRKLPFDGLLSADLMKKSRRGFYSRMSVVDVEIWFAQKAELPRDGLKKSHLENLSPVTMPLRGLLSRKDRAFSESP